ncbi:hypothetical protein BGX28_000164 [Mortierella sp. GBA30]|nr:hypothetical protein BGX28_000164 [Mortierella sp. GBA30]
MKNIHRIRSLDFDGYFSPMLQKLVRGLGQNQLVQLSVGPYSPDVEQILKNSTGSLQSFTCRGMVGLLRVNHTITPLQIQAATNYWTILSNTIHLSELSLTKATINDVHEDMFLELCGRLTSLSLEASVISALYWPSKTSFLNMRRLELIKNRVSIHDELRFITRCPSIEHFAWDPYQANLTGSVLFHFMTLSKATQALLVSLDFSNTNVSDKDFSILLSCMPGLKRLLAAKSPFGERCCEQVSVFMHDTLEELDLRACPFVASPMLQAILRSCKSLKRFRGDELCVRDMIEPRSGNSAWPRWRFTPVTNPPPDRPSSADIQLSEWNWGCVALEELELGFKGIEDCVSNKDAMDVIYGQLALLGQLRKLVLEWRRPAQRDHSALSAMIPILHPSPLAPSQETSVTRPVSLDLSLSSGLPRLEVLHKLMVLDISRVDGVELEAEDVFWMGEHWKSLRRVRGTLTTNKNEEARIREVLTRYPHIKTAF